MKSELLLLIAALVLFAAAPVGAAVQGEQSEYEFAIKTSGPSQELLQYLPKYAERGFILYLFTSRGQIGSEIFEQVLIKAKELGVRVKICPGLSTSLGGPFANENNIDEFEKLMHEILDYTESINDVVETVIFNVELGPPGDRSFREAFSKRDFSKLLDMAAENVDRAKYAAAVKRFQSMVRGVRERGYKVQITTYSLMLDDIADGDTDIQDMFDMPMQGIQWDERSFCAYSTEYGHLGGFPVSPYFVYSYSRTAEMLYGPETWIALGLIRNTDKGYKTPDQLAADIAAAKSAGIRRIDLFNFPSMLKYPDYDFDDWADATLAPPRRPNPDPEIDKVRNGMRLADFLLNFID